MQRESEISHYPKCQAMMRRIEKNSSFRLKSAVFLLFLNIPLEIIPLTSRHGLGVTVFALLYTVETLISFVFAVPEKPNVCIISTLLIMLGIIGNWLSLVFGIPLLLLLMWVIQDYKKLKWLKEQSGYPHFSERFDEQMQKFGKDYQPEHALEHVPDTEMKDISEATLAEYVPSSAQNIEMPDIPEFSERTDFHE